jgi:hypothetical protein
MSHSHMKSDRSGPAYPVKVVAHGGLQPNKRQQIGECSKAVEDIVKHTLRVVDN